MSHRYDVVSKFSINRISLSQIVDSTEFGKLVRREKSFLLLEYAPHTYLYVKDYGGICFFNFTEDTKHKTTQRLIDIAGIEFSGYTDHLQVVIGSALNDNYGEVYINELSVESAHIVCLNLAQSAALFHYQSLSTELLENTRKYTSELERKGKVSLSRKKLMQYIGSTLNLKNKISENLYVFATPMLAYENENINKIDTSLNEELEIEYRYNAIKEQLNIIQENLELFKDMNMHQHSSNLEWIIIWLILFEVIHVIIDQLL